MFVFLNPYIKSFDEQASMLSILAKVPSECDNTDAETIKKLLLKVPEDRLAVVLTDTVMSLLVFCNYSQELFYEEQFNMFFNMITTEFSYSTKAEDLYKVYEILAGSSHEEYLLECYDEFCGALAPITDPNMVLACKRVFLSKAFTAFDFFRMRAIIQELALDLTENIDSDSLEDIGILATNLSLLVGGSMGVK